MKKYNCDLHYHSPYAAACSKDITIPILAREARIKGLDILTTADILHPKWSEHVKKNLIEESDCFRYKEEINGKKIFFLLATEVETKNRIHHLLYFKDFKTIEKFKEDIKEDCQDMSVYGSGRTKLSMDGKKLLDICKKNNIVLGPAHVFTPYFGIYSHFDSLKEGYGEDWEYIKFIELGLSADTLLANTIPDLKNIKFFSFSDSHSPKSYRIGREYVCLELEKPNFQSLKDLLEDKKGNIIYNVGYDPKEGKYNYTACRACKQLYTLEQAIENKYRCIVCKGIIKKGVKDRIKEISILQGNKELKQITKRPEYKYLIPLAQVIQIAINQKNINHKKVLEIYDKFIEKYTEIEVMQEVEEKELLKIDREITKYIVSFRKNYVVFWPGGAGHYGVPYIYFTENEKNKKQKEIEDSQFIKSSQKKLF